MKILLLQYQMLGDVLTSTIIADQLKIIYPDAHIDYLIIDKASAIVKEHPSIDGTILVSREQFASIFSLLSLSRKLKNSSYDLLIDAYGKNNSAMLAFFSKIPKRIGYKKWFSKLAYTTAVINQPDKTIYQQGVSLGSRLLLTQPLVKNVRWDLKPKIYLTEGEKKTARQWLASFGVDLNKNIVMISALGSSPYKTFPFDKMAVIIDTLSKQSDSQILFNYIPSQKTEAYQIYESCLPETQKRIFIEAFAPSVREFIAVLSQCDSIVGNEGGAINMAKALKVPTFTIFSPWITKEAWNAGEDGRKHVSIHLKDFKPELYLEGSNSDRRKRVSFLYQQFEIDSILPKLQFFIEQNLN